MRNSHTHTWAHLDAYMCRRHVSAHPAAARVSPPLHPTPPAASRSVDRCAAATCCLAGNTARLDQSHVGHQQSSGTSVDELISSLVSISSAAPLSSSPPCALRLPCCRVRKRRRRSFQARTRDDDSGHGLFALFIKRAGICLVGIRAETGEHSGGTAQGRQDLAYCEICS